jgi:hypothetical protein
VDYDMRAMMRRYLHDVAVATPQDLDRLMHGAAWPAPRRYRDLAVAIAQAWRP